MSGWIGPYGGTVTTIVVDPTNSRIIYAGTFGSGVFKSVDGGKTWYSANAGISNLEIMSLAIDPVHPSTIYAGTYRSQVFKTSNGGSTWIWSGVGMQNPAVVYSLVVDPVNPSIIYSATRGESNNGYPPWSGIIYKSNNAGQTWTPSKENVGGIQDWAYSIALNPNRHEQVFAAFHESGPYWSNDSGSTWGAINHGINDFSGRSIIISPQAEFSSILYYGVWHDDSVYRTDNSGGQWTGVSSGIPGVMVYSMAIDTYSANTVYIASFSHGVLRTFDGGKNWQYGGLLPDKLYSIAVNPSATNNQFAGTLGDGIYKSVDFSASWQRSNPGLNNANVTSVQHSVTDPYIIYSSVYGAGVFQSINRGQTWIEINDGLVDKFVHDLVLDPANPWVLYALTDTGGMYRNDRSTADGWVKVGNGLPLSLANAPAYSSDHPNATLDMLEAFAVQPQPGETEQLANAGLLTMVYAPSNSTRVYLGTSSAGAYRSVDGGLSWVGAELGGQTIYSLAVDKDDPNLVYAATNIANSMKFTTDGGDSWKQAYLPGQFYSVAASPSVSGVAYAGTNAGIYRYQAGSFSSLGLADQAVTAIAFDPNHPGVILVGTSSGAYYSTNAGQSWNYVDDQLTGLTITSISFDHKIPNLVYFSTKTHGIFLYATKY